MFWLQKRNWRMAVHNCTRHGDENTETEQRWLHMALMPDITPLPVFLDVRDLMPVMEMAGRSSQQMRFETFCQTFTSCVGISQRQCNTMQVFFLRHSATQSSFC